MVVITPLCRVMVVLMLSDRGPAGGKRERSGMVLGRLLMALVRLVLLHSAG